MKHKIVKTTKRACFLVEELKKMLEKAESDKHCAVVIPLSRYTNLPGYYVAPHNLNNALQ